MKLWKQLLAFTPLVGAMIVSPASAQDEEWFEGDEDPLVIIDEQLEGLSDLLAFDFQSDLSWADGRCEDDEECEVRFTVDNGNQLFIVNGDTIVDYGPFMRHLGKLGRQLGPHMDRHPHTPRFDSHRNSVRMNRLHANSELRKLEHESRSIANKIKLAEGSEKAALEKELDQKLAEIFDYKIERQEKAIEKAEQHVANLKQRRSKRESARDDIIQNRKDELLGNSRYLEW